MISSRGLSRRLPSFCLGLLVLFILLVGMVSSSARYNQAARPGFTRADTWNNIHAFLMFDYNIPDPASIAPHYDYISGASVYNVAPLRSTNPHISLTYYLPFHRDNGTFTDNTALQGFANWQRTHPDWILYKCDRVNPAYEFGDPNVPLAFSIPTLISWQVQNYALPASQNGYDGIIADNLNMQNLFGACGTYNKSGQWVQRYSGKVNDPRWLQDVVTWVTKMQKALHRLAHPLALIPNLGIGDVRSLSNPQLQAILKHCDGVLDEAGFTQYGLGDLTNKAWLLKYQLGEYVQRQGKPFYSVNQFSALDRVDIQWALASYLMLKEHSSAVFISTIQNYGINNWHNEYNAQIGTPLNAMYEDQGVYWRDYSHGVSIVNASSQTTFTVNLNAAFQYVDVYGNPAGPVVTLAPHSGLVLLIQSSAIQL